MFPYTFVTTTSAPALIQLKGGQNCDLLGIIATSAEAAAGMFVKFWWSSNANAAPVLGVTLPDLTISIPVTGLVAPFNYPILHAGPLWVAVTKVLAGTDTTALATGGGTVTLLLE